MPATGWMSESPDTEAGYAGDGDAAGPPGTPGRRRGDCPSALPRRRCPPGSARRPPARPILTSAPRTFWPAATARACFSSCRSALAMSRPNWRPSGRSWKGARGGRSGSPGSGRGPDSVLDALGCWTPTKATRTGVSSLSAAPRGSGGRSPRQARPSARAAAGPGSVGGGQAAGAPGVPRGDPAADGRGAAVPAAGAAPFSPPRAVRGRPRRGAERAEGRKPGRDAEGRRKRDAAWHGAARQPGALVGCLPFCQRCGVPAVTGARASRRCTRNAAVHSGGRKRGAREQHAEA